MPKTTRGARHRPLLAVVGPVALLAGTGVAYAWWSTGGNGNGTGAVLQVDTVVVDVDVAVADLYPGYGGGDLSFTLTNPNPYAVTFTTMSPGIVTSGNEALCPAANVTVASTGGLALHAAAHDSGVRRSIADVVTMRADAPDGCQGIEFTVHVTLSGSQD